MSGLLHLSPELGFTQEDLADLPGSFAPCVIRDGKIARADGLPLGWEHYDLLDEGFPATLTEDGERGPIISGCLIPPGKMQSGSGLFCSTTIPEAIRGRPI